MELSIVLLILGLLAGGVLAGKSLMRASEIRSISADVTNFRTAISAFRDKYNALPGDMADATTYWGKAAVTPALCVTSGHPGTCDGNGDGLIARNSTAITFEPFRAWQHLSLSRMLDASYKGTSAFGMGLMVTPGSNAPASRIEGAGFMVYYVEGALSGDWFPTEAGHVITFGMPFSSSGTMGGAILPKEAYALDAKTDDGRPATGNVTSYTASSGYALSCTTANDAKAQYNTTTTNPCSLIFRLGY